MAVLPIPAGSGVIAVLMPSTAVNDATTLPPCAVTGVSVILGGTEEVGVTVVAGSVEATVVVGNVVVAEPEPLDPEHAAATSTTAAAAITRLLRSVR
jgi:hypothetical protein